MSVIPARSIPPATTETRIPLRAGSFVQRWLPLRDLERIALPVDRPPVDAGEVVLGEQTSVTTCNGARLALVFSQAPQGLETVQRGTRPGLERLFSERRVDGVALDADPAAPCDGVLLPRAELARVVGLLQSDDPEGLRATHGELARGGLEQDLPCVTLHHAACSRELGQPEIEAAFTECLALLALDLRRELAALADWLKRLAGRDPRLALVRARAASDWGRPVEGIAQLRVLLETLGAEDDALRPLVDAEVGRALLAAGEAPAAADVLRRAVEAGAHSEARLALGRALLACAATADRRAADALRDEARTELRRVAELGGHHAPDAWLELARSLGDSGETPAAAEACRRALTQRDTPSARELEERFSRC